MDSKAQVILVQKHRIEGPGLVGMQAAAMANGGHGVWDPVWLPSRTPNQLFEMGKSVSETGPGNVLRNKSESTCINARF